jgi:hypothetical protein
VITSAATMLVLSVALSLGELPLPDRPDRKPPSERAAPVFAPAPADPEPAAERAPVEAPPPAVPPAPASPPGHEGRIATPHAVGGRRPERPPETLAGAGALGSGGVAWLTEVGYPVLALTYGQGISDLDDLGGTARISWTTGEMLLGVLWRRELWRDGGRTAFRLVAGPWFDFGATWIYPENQANVGLEVAPGLAWTTPAGAGLASVTGDLALTWAFQRGMGVAASPRLGASYEVPVMPDVTLGARVQLWIRWGSGSAAIPGLDARLQGALSALVTWRVF